MMFFDDRYERIKTIYETEDTSVYLVRHRTLSEDRIQKRIRKKGKVLADLSVADSRNEAAVLKNLRHPGIPILYDYEEDENYICLVEEYVQGVSLAEYLEWRDAISVEQLCSFLVQICRILEYLHKREPFPILYQDLKPEHLYLRGEELMLIDYGAALFVPHSGRAFQKYGTYGYVAPEIVANGTTSVQSDIYSTGRVAAQLLAHTNEHVPSQIQKLVRWATKEVPEERPASIEIYRREWEKVYAKLSSSKGDSFPATIVVAGASQGCGTTHVAMSLVVFLNMSGQKAYYADRTDSRTTQRLVQNGPGFNEKDMIIYHYHFMALLNTGAAVCAPDPPQGIRVVDVGCGTCEDEEAEMTLCVVGSRPWQEQSVDSMTIPRDAVVILNPANRFFGSKLADHSGRKLMGFPLDADPFTLSRRKKELFEKLMTGWQAKGRRRSRVMTR